MPTADFYRSTEGRARSRSNTRAAAAAAIGAHAAGAGTSHGAVRNRGPRTLCAVLVFALVQALAGCARPDPEQALREQIATMQEAASARSVAGVMSGIDPEFIGPNQLDRDGVARLLRLQFLRHAAVGVRLGPMDVDILDDGRAARARFTAVLTGGGGGMLPDSGRVHRVETAWRLQGGEWRLVSADWRD